MRTITSPGTCACCGHVGAVWINFVKVLDCGTAGHVEPDTSLPPLCDRCEDAQSRWDTWLWCQVHPGTINYWSIYAEGPPKTPPCARAANA